MEPASCGELSVDAKPGMVVCGIMVQSSKRDNDGYYKLDMLDSSRRTKG